MIAHVTAKHRQTTTKPRTASQNSVSVTRSRYCSGVSGNTTRQDSTEDRWPER